VIVGITNQKGGVGKTTIAQNLSAALSLMGKKILLIDFDPQASLTKALLGRTCKISDTMAYVRNFYDENPIAPKAINENLLFIGSDSMLSGVADRGIDAIYGLKEGIERKLKDIYDFVLIDSLPSMGSLFLAVLAACDRVLIPVVPEFQVLNGLNDFFDTVERARNRRINPEIAVAGIIFSMVESHKRKMQTTIMDELKQEMNGLVWNTKIYKRVTISEAPGLSNNIFEYDPNGVSKDYFLDLAKEFIRKMEEA
jgi:chromosome partitioning protein